MSLQNIDPANGLMALIWCCWRSEQWFSGVAFWVVIMLEMLSLFQGCYSEGLPIHLAFVMIIDKAQGQSIYYVGIDLCVPVFSHGQLYVALSCCTSSDRIKVIFPVDSNSTLTTNVVYTEVLSGMLNHWLYLYLLSLLLLLLFCFALIFFGCCCDFT